jgi:hypothetical protein
METYQVGDNNNTLLRKILDNQNEMTGSGGTGGTPISVLPSTGATFKTLPAVAVAATGPTGRVQTPAKASPRGVLVAAVPTNSGMIFVGEGSVTNASGSSPGIPLNPQGMTSILLTVADASQIWIAGDTIGDKASITVL